MNPYDAILEQLRKAQRRGVETVSNRLDFVLESLEAIINEAKEAVKEAVPDEPDELFPVAECSRAVEEARKSLETAEARTKELEAKVGGLESRLAEAESPPGGALSLEVLRRLDGARTQSELLKELLPSLLNHVGRAVVLVVREGMVSAWSGIGFENGEGLRGWSAKVAASPILEKVVHENSVVRFSPSADSLFQSWLEGESAPSEAVIIPVVLRGRIVGGVYADRLEGAPWDVDSAQVMVAAGCWLIDTLSFRTVVPSPMLQQPADLVVEEPVPEGAGAMEETAAPEEEVTPEAGYPPVVEESQELRREPPEAVEPSTSEEPAAVPGTKVAEREEEPAAQEPPEPVRDEEPPSQWGREPAAAADFEIAEEPAATIQVDREEGWTAPEGGEEPPAAPEEEVEPVSTEPEEATPPLPEPVTPPPAEPVMPPPVVPVTPPPVEPVTPPPPEEEAPAGMGTAGTPAVSPATPPPVSPVVPPPPQEEPPVAEGGGERPPEEEAQHGEARRFARLLVSEIKLYNPEEVERGRANNDIYQRLKDDIDRSLEMYEKRVSGEVRSSHDYFREALIRILADGDEDALGM